jgi:hypothetical protein
MRSLFAALCLFAVATATFAQFSIETPEQCWQKLSQKFEAAIGTKKCQAAFEELTGMNPMELYMGNSVTLILPDEWRIGGAVAITVCSNVYGPRIAADPYAIYAFGPSYGAHVIVHELAHAANCVAGLNLKRRKDELLACQAAEACAPIGLDCRKAVARTLKKSGPYSLHTYEESSDAR